MGMGTLFAQWQSDRMKFGPQEEVGDIATYGELGRLQRLTSWQRPRHARYSVGVISRPQAVLIGTLWSR